MGVNEAFSQLCIQQDYFSSMVNSYVNCILIIIPYTWDSTFILSFPHAETHYKSSPFDIHDQSKLCITHKFELEVRVHIGRENIWLQVRTYVWKSRNPYPLSSATFGCLRSHELMLQEVLQQHTIGWNLSEQIGKHYKGWIS